MTWVAAVVAASKERHPERFCGAPRCLWRVQSRTGATTPCPRHPVQPVVAVTASVADATGAA